MVVFVHGAEGEGGGGGGVLVVLEAERRGGKEEVEINDFNPPFDGVI